MHLLIISFRNQILKQEKHSELGKLQKELMLQFSQIKGLFYLMLKEVEVLKEAGMLRLLANALHRLLTLAQIYYL